MSNPGYKLSSLFRSLGSDDEKFHDEEREMANNSEQRWPLFKSVSLARAEPTPELSAQDRQIWLKQEKSAGVARKPALSLSAFDQKLTISLDKISKWVELGAEQPAVSSEQLSVQIGSKTSCHDEPQQVALNDINLTSNVSNLGTLTASTSTPQFLKQPVAALNLEVEPHAFEHADVLPSLVKRDLPDMKHPDDSLQSLFSRIQGKEKVVVKPAERRSSFFDRLRKR